MPSLPRCEGTGRSRSTGGPKDHLQGENSNIDVGVNQSVSAYLLLVYTHTADFADRGI